MEMGDDEARRWMRETKKAVSVAECCMQEGRDYRNHITYAKACLDRALVSFRATEESEK